MARGRGGKAKRGGGHSFSRDLVLNEDGVAVSSGGGRPSRRARAADDERALNGSGSEGEESEETEEESEEEEEEEEGEEAGSAPAAPKAIEPVNTAAARAAKKAQKAKAKVKATKGGDDEDDGEDDGADLMNPNHATPKSLKASNLSPSAPMSRREREAVEKKEAQARYQKLHAAGKTDQAKTDLARLAEIRKQREAAAAQRKAEQDEKLKEAEAKAAASKQRRL